MKKTRLLLVAALSLSLATALIAFTACNGDNSGGGSGGVAATVNGAEIMEQEITDTIEAMRSQNASYTEPASWAQALSMSGLTPESLRESVIDSKVQEIVLAQEAEKEGVTVDEAAIDEKIAQTKETVGAADDEAWVTTLQQYGYQDEGAYRKMLISQDLSNQLYEDFSVEPTDEELIGFISQNPTAVEGYTLPALVDSASTSGGATEETAEESPEAGANSETTEGATPELAPVESEDLVVSVQDIDLKTMPADVLTKYRELWNDQNKGMAFQEWVTELVEASDVVINDMPEDVPYNVDMSLAEPEEPEEPVEDPTTPADLSSQEAINAAIAEGLVIVDDTVGEGEEAVAGARVRVLYTGTLQDGTVFDSKVEGDTPFEFTIGAGEVIKGWDAGVVGMKVGGKRTLTIPPSLAYGSTDRDSIPPDSTLTFVVELVEVVH